MMGVFSPKQLNIPHFPQQELFKLENVAQLANRQLNKLVAYDQITPPEFIDISETSPTHLSVLSFRRNQIFEQIAKKQMSTHSFELADAGNIPMTTRKGVQLSTRYSRIQARPLPLIAFGSSGTSVRVLQKLLVSNGYGITIDGVFGPITETAVKAFQNRRRLSTDGIVGQKTWSQLTM
ncbi:peptidoglycan-binding protein [Anabaena sp. UHCC 0253]|nr:peptidoglycan-binding protein [Anabaena sp. UHCC 0204]MTJ53303.1 peptidoglycan-binding protein [Anabaena sp. UHCC 0253]